VVDTHKAIVILNELEAEYLRIGSTHCHNLKDVSQLSAFILLGLRCTSLLKSLVVLIQPTISLAGCDAVERAFLEACQLQLEFRFLDSKKKVEDWFSGRGDSWRSDKGKLGTFVEAQKGTGFGREYGDFSVSTHPTVGACRSSVALVTCARGDNANPHQIQESIEIRSGDYANLLFRAIWTAFADEPRLMTVPIERPNLPHCVAYVDEFIGFLKQQGKAANSSVRA
jgi:hypothetical protein